MSAERHVNWVITCDLTRNESTCKMHTAEHATSMAEARRMANLRGWKYSRKAKCDVCPACRAPLPKPPKPVRRIDEPRGLEPEDVRPTGAVEMHCSNHNVHHAHPHGIWNWCPGVTVDETAMLAGTSSDIEQVQCSYTKPHSAHHHYAGTAKRAKRVLCMGRFEK